MDKDTVSAEIEKAFHEGTVGNLSPEKWDEFLAFLCAHSTSRVSGVLDPREINRGLLLNSLKNFDFIDRIERSNRWLTGITIFISLVAMLISAYAILSSESQSKNIEAIATAQEKQVRLLTDILASSQKTTIALELTKSSNTTRPRGVRDKAAQRP